MNGPVADLTQEQLTALSGGPVARTCPPVDPAEMAYRDAYEASEREARLREVRTTALQAALQTASFSGIVTRSPEVLEMAAQYLRFLTGEAAEPTRQ